MRPTSLLLAGFGFFALSSCGESPYEHPARQARAVGVDYAQAARAARAGDEASLIKLFRVTSSLDGLGGEEHCGELQELLQQYGDTRFAAVLRRQDHKVRLSVLDTLDFAFDVYARNRDWSRTFPITYSVDGHNPFYRKSKHARA
jgi:hypothetical protein